MLMKRELFFQTQWPIIQEVYPDLSHSVKPEATSTEATLVIASVENRIWSMLGEDPVYKNIGRERYKALSEEERLNILAGGLKYIQAARNLENVLDKRKRR